MCLELDMNALRKRMRPLPVRLYWPYRGWRAFGLSRVDALRGAWRISRLVAKVSKVGQ